MNILGRILKWLFLVLRLAKPNYPAKLKNKTRADFIEKIKKQNEK